MTSHNVSEILKAAVVCALYIAVTLLIAPIASGPIQFRISELFNFLAFYNKRYIASVTIGCGISNLYVSGSLGLADVIVGSLSTLVFVSLGVLFFQNVKGNLFTLGKLYLEKRFFYFNLFFSFFMLTIAMELHFILDLPFLFTWVTVALSEFISLLVGSFVIQLIARRVNLRN